MPLDAELLAWAAGLFEGEGCVYEQKSGYRRRLPYFGLGIEMCDRDIIERFAVVVALITGTPPNVTSRWRGNAKHKRQYAVKLGGSRAEAVFLALRPHLGERRQARGDEIMAKRSAAIDESREFRDCALSSCGKRFEVPLMSPLKTFCSQICAHRGKVQTPETRARQNERSRRYKERQRVLKASQPTSLF